MPNRLKKMFRDVREILIPRTCEVCQNRLYAGESIVCTKCATTLERTLWRGREGNGIERIMWEKIPIKRANATFHYDRTTNAEEVLFALKYRSKRHMGPYFGRCMAQDLEGTDFFSGIDAIVPIPLSKERLRERGYNQSELIARGIAELTNIPVRCDIVERIIDNVSQTRVPRHKREENVRDIFKVCTEEDLSRMHMLIVDDVLTTGSTIMSCGKELAKCGCNAISVLTLFVAGIKPEGPYAYEDEDDYENSLRHIYVHSPQSPKQC